MVDTSLSELSERQQEDRGEARALRQPRLGCRQHTGSWKSHRRSTRLGGHTRAYNMDLECWARNQACPCRGAIEHRRPLIDSNRRRSKSSPCLGMQPDCGHVAKGWRGHIPTLLVRAMETVGLADQASMRHLLGWLESVALTWTGSGLSCLPHHLLE